MAQRLKLGWCLFFILLLKVNSLYAFHEASYGLQSLTFANNAVMASPPLPMLYMKAGDSQFTIQYSPFTGGIDSTTTGYRTQGDFAGNGGALSYNQALTNSLGFYILGFYNKIEGDFSYTSPTCTPICSMTSMRDIKADSASLGAGINWTLTGGSDSDFLTTGLLVGASMDQISMTQRVVSTDNSSTTIDDFKMKTNPKYLSALVGFQLGMRLGGFVINPYFIGLSSFADSDCYDYNVTETTVSGSLSGQSSPSCSAGGAQNKILLKNGFTSLGLRVLYRPWGLAINAISIATEPSEAELKSLKVNAVTIALNFGG